MPAQPATVERKLARIAARSHGLVTRRELLAAGVSRSEIEHRIGTGSLIGVHRGVYRVGHRAPSLEAHYLAAVRACGAGAVLSGPAAAHLLGLVRWAAPPEVTAPNRRSVPGVDTRRSRRLAPAERTLWRGIPVTSVARTIVDLAARLSTAELARAVHEAGIRHGTTPAHVEAVLGRRPNAPGARELRRVLRGDVHVTLSRLEARFLALLRERRLALPQTNRLAGPHRVDCRWPDARLTVELDGYRFHRSRHAWERDRRREREAHARGDDFRRFTFGDVLEEPAPMLRELSALLHGLPGEQASLRR